MTLDLKMPFSQWSQLQELPKPVQHALHDESIMTALNVDLTSILMNPTRGTHNYIFPNLATDLYVFS